MFKKCEKAGLFFKGMKLKKNQIIEVNSSAALGYYQGLFSDFEDLKEVKNIDNDSKIKKSKKWGKI